MSNVPETPNPKTEARKAAFAARKAAHVDAASATPKATAHLLAAIGEDVRHRTVAGYMPIRTEIDPRPAMIQLVEAGAILCVPVIMGAGKPLGFRRWAPDCKMIDGPFGAQIPAALQWHTPDILIVPLVGFDANLNRLGYGGGFYDRTLHQLRNPNRRHVSPRAVPTRAIGFAYAGQQLPHVPQEPTDEPIDLIVTENGPLAAPRQPA